LFDNSRLSRLSSTWFTSQRYRFCHAAQIIHGRISRT
jgi:hypothetical protein